MYLEVTVQVALREISSYQGMLTFRSASYPFSTWPMRSLRTARFSYMFLSVDAINGSEKSSIRSGREIFLGRFISSPSANFDEKSSRTCGTREAICAASEPKDIARVLGGQVIERTIEIRNSYMLRIPDLAEEKNQCN